jgi:hypothetical protein
MSKMDKFKTAISFKNAEFKTANLFKNAEFRIAQSRLYTGREWNQ